MSKLPHTVFSNDVLRVALYIRVSTDEQARQGYSIEAQKEALTRYAREHNYAIIDSYIDDGYSARKQFSKRKEFMRMMDDVKNDKIDLILFIKLDRWFRSVKDYYKIQEILEAHGVNWKTTEENYDTSTTNGRLHINIRLSVAQDESDRDSDRIKFVFDSKVSRGEVITGAHPLGFMIENKRLVHDPSTVEIVRDIFNYYEHHQNKRGTLKYVRETYDLNLCGATLSRMISNPLYKGVYRDNLNFCEPIVDPAQFDRVQGISAVNIRKTPKNRTYIFTGMISCSVCHHNMVAHTQVSGKKNYVYYRCNQHFQRGRCDHKKEINEKKIEQYLLSNIEKEIEAYRVNYHAKVALKQKKPQVDKAKIRRKLEKLKDLYVNDLIDMESYRADYELYTSQLAEDPTPPEPSVDFEALNAFIESDFKTIYKTLETEEKRILWRSVIKRIEVTPENGVHIFFE